MTARAFGAALAIATTVAHAQSPDPMNWLRRMHEATQKLSYSGTFVYQIHQNEGRTETSRITRYAADDIEKLEVMNGVPREIVRTKDKVRCYLPDSRVVKVDRRVDRDFPGLLPDQVNVLERHYEISLGKTERIAGFECQTVVLQPKDNLRYGYRLYADVRNGMLMRADTVDAAGQSVETLMFTQFALGNVTREMVRPSHKGKNWRIEDAGAAPARLEGWGLASELPGFQKVIELRRRLGESRPAGQMVFSDGLAAVSVFIEPLEARPDRAATGLASMGAIHIYTREVANHMITVVGEAPAVSVQRIADAVEFRRPPQ